MTRAEHDAELRKLHARLSEVWEPADLFVWLFQRNPLLNGRRPCVLIEFAQFDRLNRLLDQIEHGVYM